MERYVGKHQKGPGHQTRDTASLVDNVRSPEARPYMPAVCRTVGFPDLRGISLQTGDSLITWHSWREPHHDPLLNARGARVRSASATGCVGSRYGPAAEVHGRRLGRGRDDGSYRGGHRGFPSAPGRRERRRRRQRAAGRERRVLPPRVLVLLCFDKLISFGTGLPAEAADQRGRPLGKITDPLALEMHRPLQLDDQPDDIPAPPEYVPREHDGHPACGTLQTAA